MMWTHDKSKKKDHLVDSEGVYARYNKIVSSINSCNTSDQLESCKRMTNNFRLWCSQSKINPRVYIFLVKFLGEKIENRASRLT